MERCALELDRLELHRLERRCLELDRLELHRLELHRMEQHRLEQHRLELDGLELHGLELHGLEQHGLEQHRLEQPGVEQHCLEQHCLEQHRVELHRLELGQLDLDGVLVCSMAMSLDPSGPTETLAAMTPLRSSASTGALPDQPSPRAVLSSAGVTTVCVGLGAVALAVTATVALRDGERGLSHPVAFVILALLLTYTHIRPTRLLHRYGGVDSDYLDEALFVPMVLMLDSVEIAVAAAVASLAGNL